MLPLVGPHFSNRFPDETFLIYDEAHHMAYVQQENRAEIFPLESLELPAPDAEELFWRRLWKRFFQTIAVEGRINPRCQMTHMPKRYWKNMVEQQPDPADIPLRNAALASPISAAALQSSNRPGRG